jgi:hypothetical protein
MPEVRPICRPALWPEKSAWCCTNLEREVCDMGDTCDCWSERASHCDRPYFLTDDLLLLKVKEGHFLDTCPHCGAVVEQG